MFVNELVLYVKYLHLEIDQVHEGITEKQAKYFQKFRTNLLEGIAYYHQLIPAMNANDIPDLEAFRTELESHAQALRNLLLPEARIAVPH